MTAIAMAHLIADYISDTVDHACDLVPEQELLPELMGELEGLFLGWQRRVDEAMRDID